MTPPNERHDLALTIETLLVRPGVGDEFKRQIDVFQDWCAEWIVNDAKWPEDHAALFTNQQATYNPDIPTWEPDPWARLRSIVTCDPDPRRHPLTNLLYNVKPNPPLDNESRRLCLRYVGLAILHDLALSNDARVTHIATTLDQEQVERTQNDMGAKWASWKPVIETDLTVVEANSAGPTTEDELGENAFVRSGDTGYVVRFQGNKQKIIPRMKGKLPGLDYIQVLLRHEAKHHTSPHRICAPMSPQEVMREVYGATLDCTGDRQPQELIDDRAWEESQRRRGHLQESIDDPQTDPAEKAEHKEELQHLEQILRKSTHPDGKNKPKAKAFFGKMAKQADSIRKATDRAICEIGKQDSVLAEHLKKHIDHKGGHSYTPDSHIDWNLG